MSKLEKGIDNTKNFIAYLIEKDKKSCVDTKEIHIQIKEIQRNKHQYRKLHASTLNKIQKHALIEDSIDQVIVQGKKRRSELITKIGYSDMKSQFQETFNKQNLVAQQLEGIKKVLMGKLKYYESASSKIAATVKGGSEAIILQIQRGKELAFSYNTLENKKQLLLDNKEMLIPRLNFLSTKEHHEPVFNHGGLETTHTLLLKSASKLAYYSEQSKLLKAKYINCVEILKNIWENIKIKAPFQYTGENKEKTISRIKDRLLLIQSSSNSLEKPDLEHATTQDSIKSFIASRELYMQDLYSSTNNE